MIAGAGETFQEIIGAGSIKVNIPGLPGHHSIRRAWSRVMTEVGWIYPGIPRHSPGFPAGRRLNNLKGTRQKRGKIGTGLSVTLKGTRSEVQLFIESSGYRPSPV